jgi:hypothetical protein
MILYHKYEVFMALPVSVAPKPREKKKIIKFCDEETPREFERVTFSRPVKKSPEGLFQLSTQCCFSEGSVRLAY